MNEYFSSGWQNLRRYLYVMPMAFSVAVLLLVCMVRMTAIDTKPDIEDAPKRVVDFIMVEPNIDTIVLAPVKPEEPLPEPKTFELSENLSIDESALNMRPEVNFNQFKAPKLTVSNNFSYMGLGRRHTIGSRAKPSYPREAKHAQIEGTVYLQFDINKRGIPTNISVLESKPKGVFDQAAINAVKKWRYAKKYSHGKLIGTPNFRNRINFRLDEMNLASTE
jgi:protein TonB